MADTITGSIFLIIIFVIIILTVGEPDLLDSIMGYIDAQTELIKSMAECPKGEELL